MIKAKSHLKFGRKAQKIANSTFLFVSQTFLKNSTHFSVTANPLPRKHFAIEENGKRPNHLAFKASIFIFWNIFSDLHVYIEQNIFQWCSEIKSLIEIILNYCMVVHESFNRQDHTVISLLPKMFVNLTQNIVKAVGQKYYYD